MRRAGLLLLLIASFVLPTFGGMAFSMPAQPCSMMQAEHVMMDTSCCEQTDNSNLQADESPCKSGQKCKTGSLLQTVVIKTIAPHASRPEVLPSQSLIERAPTQLWRPPRFV